MDLGGHLDVVAKTGNLANATLFCLSLRLA